MYDGMQIHGFVGALNAQNISLFDSVFVFVLRGLDRCVGYENRIQGCI
jgi:hypothetical protein